jgi:hypothetical protein
MSVWTMKRILPIAVMSLGLAVGCGDDEGNSSTENSATREDSGAPLGEDPGTTPGKDASTSSGENEPGRGPKDASSGSSGELDAGSQAGDDAGEAVAGPTYPELPSVLALTGCSAVPVGPLCTVSQDEGNFTANCAGVSFTGSLSESGELSMTAETRIDRNGASVDVSCTGKFGSGGTLVASCRQVTGASDAGAQAETTCDDLRSKREPLPGVSCMALPAQLTNVVVCKEGAAGGGTTLDAGTCKVSQDGCSVQLDCADDVTITGTATATGMSFSRTLVALADAQTPATGSPAFLKGASVSHSCTGTIDGSTLTGTCTAGGAGRGGTPTSVCAVEASLTPVASCGLIAPTSETLFTLDSCEQLEEGEGSSPGIGEPVCAFRQNNCVWDIQCGRGEALHFAGKLAAGASKAEWRLATGTPCELGFDASGNVSGKCTVPGQAACELSSKTPVPGGAGCPVVFDDADFTTSGCGSGADCRLTMQHGCNFLALCSFGPRYPSLTFAGEASTVSGRSHLSFNGIGDYACEVDQSLQSEVDSGDRVAGEWYGQCTNSVGGQCRNNYNAETKTGFRGLRLYF